MTLTSVAPIIRFVTSSGKLKDLGFVLSKLSLLAEVIWLGDLVS